MMFTLPFYSSSASESDTILATGGNSLVFSQFIKAYLDLSPQYLILCLLTNKIRVGYCLTS